MSRYRVTQQTSDVYGATAYYLADIDRGADAILYPDLGCNCVEFRTTPDPEGRDGSDRNGLPVNLFVPPRNLSELRRSSACGGQPILFPFPNRVRAGAYTFDGQDYTLARQLAAGHHDGSGNAIHGLVGDRPWEVEDAHADEDCATIRCSFKLDASPDIYAQYPFPCTIAVTYRLHDGTLAMTTEVVNTGEVSLPMGFGIHPWFPTALRPGASLSELAELSARERASAEVCVPACALWELNGMLPTGEVISAEATGPEFKLSKYRPLNGHYYDHVFTEVIPDRDGWSHGGVRDPATGLELTLDADPGFREWVVYAPPHAPIVCLEPYTCTTDAVNLSARGVDGGLIRLQPGETWRGNIRFGLRRFTKSR